MNQLDFNKLLEKYLDGQCTPDEEKLVSEWYDKQNQIETQAMSNDQKQVIEKRIWLNIRRQTIGEKRVLGLIPPQYLRIISYSAAASVALLAIFWFQLPANSELPNTLDSTSKTDVEIKNTSRNKQEVRLDDGSLVILNPKSTLSYHGNFGNKTRHVYLTGTAFFDVKRDTTKPFLVHTPNITTEVLGTSFRVVTDEKGEGIEVSVLTGKVLIYENKKSKEGNKKSVLLTANQKIKYLPTKTQLSPEIVEQPIVIGEIPEPTDLVFEDAPLTEVVKEMKKMYKLEIIVANNDLNKCLLTADLNGLTMFTQLDLICKSIGARYEVRGTYIFIDGLGCDD